MAHDSIDNTLPFVAGTMVQHFQSTQQWEKLRRVLPVYLESKLSQPNMAVLLRAIDVTEFGDDAPVRPHAHTIDRQIEMCVF